MKALFILFVALAALSAVSALRDPDLPGFPGDLQTLYSCSIIIPTDEHQYNDRGVLQLTAYGLVTHLLWSDIPVKWIIRTGKAKDSYDFNASVWDYGTLPGQDVFTLNRTSEPVSRSFRGGPFAVERRFLEFATPYIHEFQLKHPEVKMFRLAETITVDVRYELLKKPMVAILDSSRNNIVQRQILDAAGFVHGKHYAIFTKEQANNLSAGTCITAATEPHFHAWEDWRSSAVNYNPDYSPHKFVAAMREFVESGGNFLAQCGGVSTYENCDTGHSYSGNDYFYVSPGPSMNATVFNATRGARRNFARNCTDGLFMTEKGLNLVWDTNVIPAPMGLNRSIFEDYHPDLPISQWIGTWEPYTGSVQGFTLWNMSWDSAYLHDQNKTDSGWRTENAPHPIVGYPVTADGLGSRDIFFAAHAKLAKFHGAIGGNVFYLSGHRFFDVIYHLNANNNPPRPQLCPEAPMDGFWECPFNSTYNTTGVYCINGDDDCYPIMEDLNTTACNSIAQRRFGNNQRTCEFGNGGRLNPGRQFFLNAVLHPAERDPACNFNVDPCKWGACNFVKKRDLEERLALLRDRKRNQQLINELANLTAPDDAVPCDCDRVFDCIGNCGGDGTPERLCQTAAELGAYNGGASTGIVGSANPGLPPGVLPSWPVSPGTGNTPTDTVPAAPSVAPSSVITTTGLPSGGGPVPSNANEDNVNGTNGQIGIVLAPGEVKYYLVKAGSNVGNLNVFVSVLSPGLRVDVYMRRGDYPTTSEYHCYLPDVSELEFSHRDYSLRTDPATCAPPLLPEDLSGDWVIAIVPSENTASVHASIEVFLEALPPGVAPPRPLDDASSTLFIAVTALLSALLAHLL